MASFTSSFKERSTRIFALTALLVVGVAAINHATPDPAHEAAVARERFWQHKVHALPDHAFNIVASGDSRVYRGFSPETMEAVLPGLRVYNYGFSSGGHNAFIFRNIEDLLIDDPKAPRVVILGISPYSLTPKAQANSQYNDVFRKGPLRWDAAINEFFRGMTVDRLKEMIRGPDMTPSNAVYEYLENGYVRSDWRNRNPDSELKVFETDFDGNAVDPKTVNDVLQQTKIWSRQGIMVLGYRPPTTPAMEAVEARKSGFDEEAFVKAFRENGGIWVDPGDDFQSYDGSHLTPESTDKLSQILGRTIARQIISP